MGASKKAVWWRTIVLVVPLLWVLAPDAGAAEPLTATYLDEASYPSASECAECHQQIYNEWASSNHAYASISPMFHKFEQRISDLTQGTIGTFCVRCHQQVGTQRGEARELPLWERSAVAREGVTCITCHRVSEEFGKVNGERTVVPGDIHLPVAGTLRGSVFDKVVARADELKITTESTARGTKIHAGVYEFDQLGKSEFCMSCHQVAVNLGIKLEVVWDQFRDSPAFRNGVTCQDCHMGAVPGRAEGYATGPSAIVNDVPINPERRHSNHSFYGPGYPIAHPGIFPHNPEARRWTIQEWLKFDFRAHWGEEEFEESIADVAEAVDGVHSALEALGGGLDALSALSDLESVAARGQGAFGSARTIEQSREALDALDGVVDGDALEESTEELDTALEDLAEAIEEFGSVTGPPAIDRLHQAAKAMLAEAPARMNEFEGALELVSSTFDVAAENPTDDSAKQFSGAIIALRHAMPAANNAFQSALTEIKVAVGVNFPTVWSDAGDREEAREIVTVNEGRLEDKREHRRQVMENGSRIDGPFFESDLRTGEDLKFKYIMTNTDDGHNLPSGSLGAQPEIWMNVALIGPAGNNLWESGYVDANGDFADVHSLEVAAGTIEYDDQLVNLQSKFLTTNIKGTDREMYLPVNFDVDQLPFLRPANVPTSVLNHAPFVRMEARSIPPLGSREASYRVPAALIEKPGSYRLAVRMRSRAEPIYFMRFVDATKEMERSMNQWMLDIHPYTVEFEVGE